MSEAYSVVVVDFHSQYLFCFIDKIEKGILSEM